MGFHTEGWVPFLEARTREPFKVPKTLAGVTAAARTHTAPCQCLRAQLSLLSSKLSLPCGKLSLTNFNVGIPTQVDCKKCVGASWDAPGAEPHCDTVQEGGLFHQTLSALCNSLRLVQLS